MTTVVNKRKEEYDIYIGRGSLLGNPYEIGIDGDREQVIERYKIWFNHLLKSQVFRRELEKCKGKKLGCFCAPLACHGDVIAYYLNKL